VSGGNPVVSGPPLEQPPVPAHVVGEVPPEPAPAARDPPPEPTSEEAPRAEEVEPATFAISPAAEFVVVLALIAVGVAILEYFYAQNPVPPGVDPGDWIQRSYAWVGLVHPPVNSVGSPYLYPPMIFPLLGALRLATGSPESTGFIFGAGLLAVYGLTLWLLARTAFHLPSHRLALVALGLLNGTVVSMLFWGGYPNFLAFSFVNLTLACLLLFLRGPSTVRALGLWGFAALTYLTHTLTFDLVLAVVLLAFLFVLLLRRLPWRQVLHRGNIAGLVLLGAVVGTYTAVTDVLHIPHIDYLHSNPPAFTLVGLGTLFTPLGRAPSVTPMGNPFVASPLGVAGILAATGLAALLVPVLLAWRRPGRWGYPVLVGGSWLGLMLLAPVGGFLVHVDTDYSRFVYFFPLPVAFAAVAIYEGALPASLVEPVPQSPDAVPAPPSRFRVLRPRPYAVLSGGALAVAVAFLLVNVTIPTMALGEQTDAVAGHDAPFLAAIDYLVTNPAAGSVLTTQSAARWTEALTARGAFDAGPTWLQFESWEITNAQEAYFALNSETGTTNNLLVASYSGYATTSLSQAPMVSALVLGVPVPILRVLPATELTDTSGPGCSGWTAAAATGPPSVAVPGPTPVSGALRESNACATTTQTTTLSPGSPTLWLNYTVTPTPGDQLLGFNLTMATPPPKNAALHAGPATAITAAGPSLSWSTITALGQFPGGGNVTLTGSVAPTPVSALVNASNGTGQVAYGFGNPSPSAPLSISFEMQVPSASNPAIVLPTVLSTPAFLAANSIRFLLLPSTAPYAETIEFFAATFGFVTVFANSEWTVLQAPAG